MWAISAIQMHAKALIVCDEDATMELHVKVKKKSTFHICIKKLSQLKKIKDSQIL